jgi:Amt family ammonium transporter
VFPLHGLCGLWGGISAGIFGSTLLGGIGGVSLTSQVIGSVAGLTIAFVGGYVIYGVLKKTMGIRLSDEEEYDGADMTIHHITATPERETRW